MADDLTLEALDSRIGLSGPRNVTGISLRRTEGGFNNNEISGGGTGVRVWISGSPSFVGNTNTGGTNRGFFIGVSTSPFLSGNVICDNRLDLAVAGGAYSVRADDNEIYDRNPDLE